MATLRKGRTDLKPFFRVKERNSKNQKKKDVSDKVKNPSRSSGWKKPKTLNETFLKYNRGKNVELSGVKTHHFKAKQQRKEIYLDYATEQAARSEILLQENHGFIEPGKEEITALYRQEEIVKNVDIQSASKHFKLDLSFGPYTIRYTNNGRHLLLGGRSGHLAALDWITKKLYCEVNVMEEVLDIAWMHIHTMFACAQRKWVFFYSNQGTELHCIKRLHQVNRLEFLPYHFLLATGSKTGYVSWLDISIGEIISSFNTRLGEIRVLRQNPANGVICTGGGNGVVSMWAPKLRQPLAKILCHSTAISALTVDPKGLHMVTAGMDRKVKVWDVRALKGPITEYSLRLPANEVEVSQRGVLAIAQGSYLELHQNLVPTVKKDFPYLKENCTDFVQAMRFCPYEDILGVGTSKGFQSLLIPGSGEPNFDALEANPFQTKSQRREHEVHSLLEKIPADLISLNPFDIATIDVPTLQEKIEAKSKLFFIKPPAIEFKTRHRKTKGNTAKMAHNKQIVKDAARKEFVSAVRHSKQEIIKNYKVESTDENSKKPSVLDRFKPKHNK